MTVDSCASAAGESPLEGLTKLQDPRQRSFACVFPPALVPVLRDWFQSKGEGWGKLEDDLLLDLITTVFFAGLTTHEGLYHPVRVAFMGTSTPDIVMPEGAEAGSGPLYRWKVLRFEASRPFVIPELVKLAAARTGERFYTAACILDGGQIGVAGLAREGFKGDADPFIELVASRPGHLSIRSGHECLVEYERGLMYRMTRDSSITSLLRLSRRLRGTDPRRTGATTPSQYPTHSILMRNAFAAEIQRVVEEYGALTAIDGATVLNRSLALVAFGVVLPVGSAVPVTSADPASARRTIDLGSRGTRHRAAATYAAAHLNSVVFVASEDGPISCLLRSSEQEPVMLWHLGAAGNQV